MPSPASRGFRRATDVADVRLRVAEVQVQRREERRGTAVPHRLGVPDGERRQLSLEELKAEVGGPRSSRPREPQSGEDLD